MLKDSSVHKKAGTTIMECDFMMRFRTY